MRRVAEASGAQTKPRWSWRDVPGGFMGSTGPRLQPKTGAVTRRSRRTRLDPKVSARWIAATRRASRRVMWRGWHGAGGAGRGGWQLVRRWTLRAAPLAHMRTNFGPYGDGRMSVSHARSGHELRSLVFPVVLLASTPWPINWQMARGWRVCGTVPAVGCTNCVKITSTSAAIVLLFRPTRNLLSLALRTESGRPSARRGSPVIRTALQG